MGTTGAEAVRIRLDEPELPAPRAGKTLRVLLFYIYFSGLGFAVPWFLISWVQAEYGLIDGPPLGAWSTVDGGFTNGWAVLRTTDPVIDMRTMFPFRDQVAVDQRAAAATLPTPEEQATEAIGERIKTATMYNIFAWTAMQLYFFGRIASSAGGEPAVPGVAPVAVDVLMQRLLTLNQQDIPFATSRGKRANEIIIDWRYTDAKWLDLMRIRGMRGAYRLMLRLDKGKHNARAQDRYSAFDWSAGRGPDLASVKWKASSGITFSDYKYERAFGLQFRNGKPTFDLSYAYTFDLNELKQPIIDIIRNAGWNFRPVITFFRPVGG